MYISAGTPSYVHTITPLHIKHHVSIHMRNVFTSKPSFGYLCIQPFTVQSLHMSTTIDDHAILVCGHISEINFAKDAYGY